jgi:hypothetical protein
MNIRDIIDEFVVSINNESQTKSFELRFNDKISF